MRFLLLFFALFLQFNAASAGIQGITCWVWDGNVPLHEQKSQYWQDWDTDKDCEFYREEKQPLVTWVFEEGTFVPAAKITENESFSIVTDYLGTPTNAYQSDGTQIWERQLNSYGGKRAETGGANFVPFRFQGQYFDGETGLCYNRFRYYDPDSGNYISQDPIGLDGNNPTLYAYVHDPNSWLDPFGLDLHHATPIFMGGTKKQNLVYLNNADHVQLHRDMNAFLETKTKVVGGEAVSMRPKRGNRGVTIQQNFSQKERFDALAEFYTINEAKYKGVSDQFFQDNAHLQKQKISCSS